MKGNDVGLTYRGKLGSDPNYPNTATNAPIIIKTHTQTKKRIQKRA